MKKNDLIEQLAEGRLSRRQLLRKAAALGIVVSAVPLTKRAAFAAEEEHPTYFTWAGYDLPEMFTPYVEKHGQPPNFAVFGDTEEALTKIRAGYVVDVAHPCNSSYPRWRDTGLFQPVDTSRLSNWPDVVQAMKSLPGGQQAEDGGYWFVPWEWGQTSVTYRTDLVELPEGEETWGLLWDERYKGRIMVIGSQGDAWWATAIYAGVAFDNLTEENIEKVNGLLREQRPLVRKYTLDATEWEQALRSGEVVAAMTWNESAVKLKKDGVPVKFADPKEGALTWCCGVMMHKDAPNPDLAYEVIDAMLSPEVGEYCITSFGYGHSNKKSFERVPPDVLEELALTPDPDDTLSRGKFQIPKSQEVVTRLERDFQEIMAGF